MVSNFYQIRKQLKKIIFRICKNIKELYSKIIQAKIKVKLIINQIIVKKIKMIIIQIIVNKFKQQMFQIIVNKV